MNMVEALLARYGLVAVFLGCLLEGETIALLGGMMAHRGLFSLQQTMLAAFLGSLASDQILFWVGRRRRRWLMRSRLAQRQAFSRAMALIGRYPRGFILAFRFLYGLRIVSPLAIGASRVPALRFAMFNLVAAALWAVLLSSGGYLAWHAVSRLIGEVRSVEAFLLGAVLLAGVIALALNRGIQWRSGVPRGN